MLDEMVEPDGKRLIFGTRGMTVIEPDGSVHFVGYDVVDVLTLYECAPCSAKPGSPLLCPRCLAARTAAGDAWKGPRR